MRARNQVASKDGEIRLCDVPAEVREVLVLLKLDGVLRIYDSTEAAFRDLPEK
jgi:anti-anti-sigma regulatory factor